MSLDKWYSFRQQILDVLEADLMGGPDDLTIDEPPLDRFVLGVLHPRSVQKMDEADADADSGSDGGGADAVFDPAVALSRMRYPSSMGMTFAVDTGQTRELVLEVSAAQYTKSDETSTWHRNEPTITPVTVTVDRPAVRRPKVTEGLELYVVVRAAVQGIASITVVLINAQEVTAPGQKDSACWFQPKLTVRSTDGWFVARHTPAAAGIEDADLASYDLLFRDVEDLAVGHGCAVTWDEDAERVDRLETTFLPWYDLKLAEPGGGGGLKLPMASLADGDWDVLDGLIAHYRAWITQQRTRIDGLVGPELRATATRHMDDANRAADRMQAGLNALRADADAGRAFRLMNRAMDLQRTRQDLQRGVEPGVQTWRPFQMAFVLLNIEGLTDPSSPDRETADLLWFPTGGGKTEAYLGLIGYTILLRRIHDPKDGGVSVLMRYTLRLLTIQQFERAAGLICALESIRKEEMPDAVGISLGLWVGQGATPNNVKDARKALKLLQQGDASPYGNPRQLLQCPVCGAHISYDDYRFPTGPDRMQVRCSSSDCEYRLGLPVHLVDEDVYRERPSLVIGTVDKFAMMAWRAQVRSLFGRDGANSPPDLIVQDELHLISGPLGTMVGLYEVAVDAAATATTGVRPKVVASTATIRRATEQVRAVFDRRSSQFPPPGLDSTDSYFSKEAPADRKGTRRYLGVMAPSVSHTTLMVRCYAALLQAAKDLPGDDEVRDAYWTLMGYFNSLRVLGGAFMQVHDDIPDRLKVLSGRKGTEPREVEPVRELTSRKDSSEIPEELKALETSFPSEDSPNVVLATNMISVGLDVDRLGLMAVMGQPQTTAEYIQATSRVGRQRPGLVVVIYNSSRSRDMSHYENFGAYHRSIYRQVEATGATPFAARARDRGLHGVLVAMSRLLIDELAPDERAVQMPKLRAKVDVIVDAIVARAARIDDVEAPRVRKQLERLVSNWAEACDQPVLKYPGWQPPFSGVLLHDPSKVLDGEVPTFPVDMPAWPTMTSLRDVDATSGLYLVPAADKKVN